MKRSVLSILSLTTWASTADAGRLWRATRHGLVPDAVTPNAVPMRRHELKPTSAQTGPGSLHKRAANRPANLTNVHDVYYIIDLEVGNQIIPVSIDTGSSDTWFVKEPYECVSFWWQGPNVKPDCGLGAGFQGNPSGGVIDNIPFGRAYMDGTFVEGYYGYEDITIGGITASHQRIALVNYTYWSGDGRTSGLLGLAYPYMTSLDGPLQNQPPYDPVFTTMWKDELIDPLFSIALSRHENQGAGEGTGIQEQSYLALGGLPPVEVDEASWERTPILGVNAIPEWGFEEKDLGLYIIKPDGWVYGKESVPLVVNNTQVPVLIDAGATLSLLPRHLVQNLYAAFDPPAKYLSTNGLFFALCNATVPKFGVIIGKNTFYFSPDDLLRQTARDPSGEYCRIGVTDVSGGPYVLGVSWMTNVVAVFDIENTEMRFASRTKY
ncbi:putative eukaryotic aspartyl protease [Podospora australis]|uniref:Eukaryotic aspartyl protease n=1 Tax=Podospora australis TaxID=1536484 RepID=A0AAN7ABX8_9PEZI|nr:putative eukaryotic aspartyl protease [Podospora australis]